MGLLDVSRFFRVILIIFPIGVGFTYWGMDGLGKTVDDLPYIEGELLKSKNDFRYYESCDCRLPTYSIYLEGYDSPYITKITKYIDLINSFQLKEGDRIEIWLWDKTTDNRIKQLKVNGEIVIPYDRTLWLNTIFLIVGLGLVVVCIGYFITSSGDFFGKNKK
jgi:hypothetical protein